MKEKIIFLGTGNAAVTRCFNTCFAIKKGKEYFLVDTGGGNGILTQLEKAEIPLGGIHHIFISHGHTDHLLGVVWMIRMIGSQMNRGDYQGKLKIYAYPELIKNIKTIAGLTIQDNILKLLDNRICFKKVRDQKQKKIMGYPLTFFDIRSKKEKQFGFTLELTSGKKLTFLGDEPYYAHEKKYVKQADWLLHEAFCLYSQRDQYHPYEKAHTTVKEACQVAEDLKVKNLVLYHTEDQNIDKRKELYSKEGKNYYNGNIFVPDDLEAFEL